MIADQQRGDSFDYNLCHFLGSRGRTKTYHPLLPANGNDQSVPLEDGTPSSVKIVANGLRKRTGKQMRLNRFNDHERRFSEIRGEEMVKKK
jgi:hypothetical protein